VGGETTIISGGNEQEPIEGDYTDVEHW
jgi:hypothetical protein